MFPRSISDVSNQWLKKVTGYEVKHFTFDNVSEGRGFAGEVFKLKLIYAHSDLISNKNPSTLIVKFASQNPTTKKMVRPYAINETKIYSNLSKFYEGLLPSIYYSGCDEKTGDCCILMEDLSTKIYGDSLRGLSLAQSISATTSIARFHSSFWGTSKLSQFSWLKHSKLLLRFMSKIVKQHSPIFLDSYGNSLSREFQELVAIYPHKMTTIWNRLMDSPVTICHGDFRPDNFFFDDDGNNITVIDWQLCSEMKGIVDIAYLFTWGLDEKNRKSWESQLLTHYHDTLISKGIKDYSESNIRKDYILGLFVPFQILIVASTALNNGSQRGEQLISLVIKRMQSIIDDHNLLSQLSRI